jgi:CRISPR-associated protein Cas5t
MRFAPPSALYGLLLNVAGVDMRGEKTLPSLRMALAATRRPTVSTLVQQLHLSPVGSAAKPWEPFTKGSKPSISQARRELLCGLEGYCLVQANAELETAITEGLAGNHKRYGLPFLGDNNFLLDDLRQVEPHARPVEWLTPANGSPGIYLTLWVGRGKAARVRAAQFTYREGSLDAPPEDAWTEITP